MKAIVQTGYGSPDVLELREVARPDIGADGVLVRVRAASVNAADWHFLHRVPSLLAKLAGMRRSRVRGSDLSGVVEAVGASVTAFRPGDEVFGTAYGTFAEFVAATEDGLAHKPRNVSYEQAAAVPLAGLTALQALRDAGQLGPGQAVLVYGAGGGVGTFAVQVAKALGARVTAVTHTRSVDLLRSLGADEVIDYTREDFTARGPDVDVLLDLGANRPFAECLRVLRPTGIHVPVGAPGTVSAMLARMLEAQFALRSRRKRSGGPTSGGSGSGGPHSPGPHSGESPASGPRIASFLTTRKHDDLRVLRDLLETGRLVPVIDRRFPLSAAAEAVRYVGTREARGKVVVNID